MEAVTPEQLLDTPDLIAAGVAGDDVRRRMHGRRTRFNRVFEIHVAAPPQAVPPRTHAGEFRLVGRAASVNALVASARNAVTLAAGVPVTIDAIDDVELVVGDAMASGIPILTLVVENLDHDRRLDMCRRAFDLQKACGGFQAFAPLPRTMSVTRPSTGYDDVRQIALARMVVDNIPSIQVDWVLYGPKLAQVALTVGADDVDNVAAEDPGMLGTRRSPLEEIRGNIRAAALEPVERDGLFRERQP